MAVILPKLTTVQNDPISGPDNKSIPKIIEALKQGKDASPYNVYFQMLDFGDKSALPEGSENKGNDITAKLDQMVEENLVFCRVDDPDQPAYQNHVISFIQNGQISSFLSGKAYREAMAVQARSSDKLPSLCYIPHSLLNNEQRKAIGLNCV